MKVTRIKGFILEIKNYREYDELCWILTEQGSIISAIIRGTKKKKAKYNGQLEAFTVYYFDVQLRQGLSTIYEFERVHRFVEKEESLLPLFLYGSQINELLRKIGVNLLPSAQLFFVVEKLYGYIAKNIFPDLACSFLEKYLSASLGISYVFHACVHCGNIENIFAFSFEEGGLICHNCRLYVRCDIQDVTVLKSLIAFDRLDILQYPTMQVTSEISRAIQFFWKEVYESNHGIQLKSQQISMKGFDNK